MVLQLIKNNTIPKNLQKFKTDCEAFLRINQIRINNFQNPKRIAKAKEDQQKVQAALDAIKQNVVNSHAVSQSSSMFQRFLIDFIDKYPQHNETKLFKCKNKIFTLHKIGEVITIQDVTNAGYIGKECKILRFYANARLNNDEFLPIIENFIIRQLPFEKILEFFNLSVCENHFKASELGIELENPDHVIDIYLSKKKSSEVFRFWDFSVYKPLKEKPNKWTMPHVIRALANYQFKNLTMTYSHWDKTDGVILDPTKLLGDLIGDRYHVGHCEGLGVSFYLSGCYGYNFTFTLESQMLNNNKIINDKKDKEKHELSIKTKIINDLQDQIDKYAKMDLNELKNYSAFNKEVESNIKNNQKVIDRKLQSIETSESKPVTRKRSHEQQNWRETVLSLTKINLLLYNLRYKENKTALDYILYKLWGIHPNYDFDSDLYIKNILPQEIIQENNIQEKIFPIDNFLMLIDTLDLTDQLKDRIRDDKKYFVLMRALEDYCTYNQLNTTYEQVHKRWLEELHKPINDDQLSGLAKEFNLKEKLNTVASNRKCFIDYFPTPQVVVDKMLELVSINNPAMILEPSAGTGNIADVLRERYPEATLELIEISEQLREILKLKGYENNFVKHTNEFLTHIYEDIIPDLRNEKLYQRYDLIVMNPPFSSGLDCRHVVRAIECLKVGGQVIAIMSPTWVSNPRGDAAKELKEYLNKGQASIINLATGSFSASNTNVNSIIFNYIKE